MGYNSVADSTGLSSFVLPSLPLKSAKSREIPRKFELIAVQRSSKVINLGAKRKHIVTLDVSRYSRTIFEILTHKSRPESLADAKVSARQQRVYEGL